MRSCWRGGFLETLLWFPTGGAAIGRAVENVLPVVLAAEAFGEVKKAKLKGDLIGFLWGALVITGSIMITWNETDH